MSNFLIFSGFPRNYSFVLLCKSNDCGLYQTQDTEMSEI